MEIEHFLWKLEFSLQVPDSLYLQMQITRVSVYSVSCLCVQGAREGMCRLIHHYSSQTLLGASSKGMSTV